MKTKRPLFRGKYGTYRVGDRIRWKGQLYEIADATYAPSATYTGELSFYVRGGDGPSIRDFTIDEGKVEEVNVAP